MDEEIKMHFASGSLEFFFLLFFVVALSSCFFFVLQRKHTHNVASQYLLPCHDVSLPSRRVHRADVRSEKVGRKRDVKLTLNEGKGTEPSAP